MQQLDLIVIGLGAMGSAVALHAQEHGVSVLGIDRFDPPHNLGSTHAESRISRLAVAEGEQYLPFVKRSHEIWFDLESRTNAELFYETCGYICTEPKAAPGQRWKDFVVETARIAEAAGIDYTVMSPAELRANQSVIRVPDGRRVGFEPSARLVMAERAVTVQRALAVERGADLHANEQVVGVVPDDHGVVVTTDLSSYRADHVVIAAGPWMHELTQPIHQRQLQVTRRRTTISSSMQIRDRIESQSCLHAAATGSNTAPRWVKRSPNRSQQEPAHSILNRFDHACSQGSARCSAMWLDEINCWRR